MSNNTFQWTNELLYEWGVFYMKDLTRKPYDKLIEDFKQTKIPKKQETLEEWLSKQGAVHKQSDLFYTFIYCEKACYGQVSIYPDGVKLTVRPQSVIENIGKYAGEPVYFNFPRLKEQPKKERIEVTAKYGYNNNPYIVEVHSSHVIASDKVICICKAAERVLNDEGDNAQYSLSLVKEKLEISISDPELMPKKVVVNGFEYIIR